MKKGTAGWSAKIFGAAQVATHPPVATKVVGAHTQASPQGMRHDIMPEVGVGACIRAEVLLVLSQQAGQGIPCEHVDPHAGLKGAVRGGVLAGVGHALKLRPCRLLCKICHQPCTFATPCEMACLNPSCSGCGAEERSQKPLEVIRNLVCAFKFCAAADL